MIIGSIDNDFQHLSHIKGIGRVLDYISKANFRDIVDGKHLIDRGSLFFNLTTYRTTYNLNKLAEVHWEYIDFQYLLQGEEVIGWANYSTTQKPAIKYSQQDDVAFFDEVQDESHLLLKEGMYAIFYPNDIHRPGLQASRSCEVRKAVFKIKI